MTQIDRWEVDTSVVLDDNGIALVKASRDDAYQTRPALGAWHGARFALANSRMIAATLDYVAAPSWDFPDLPGQDARDVDEEATARTPVDPDLLRRDQEMYPQDANP